MRTTASSALSLIVIVFFRFTILELGKGVSVQFFCRKTKEAPGREDRGRGTTQMAYKCVRTVAFGPVPRCY